MLSIDGNLPSRTTVPTLLESKKTSTVGAGTESTALGETQPVVQTQDPEMRNRRTVTEVRGFVRGHPTLLNGKYAAVIFREYVESATRPIVAPTAVESEVNPGG